jgi:hypothetical protein
MEHQLPEAVLRAGPSLLRLSEAGIWIPGTAGIHLRRVLGACSLRVPLDDRHPVPVTVLIARPTSRAAQPLPNAHADAPQQEDTRVDRDTIAAVEERIRSAEAVIAGLVEQYTAAVADAADAKARVAALTDMVAHARLEGQAAVERAKQLQLTVEALKWYAHALPWGCTGQAARHLDCWPRTAAAA